MEGIRLKQVEDKKNLHAHTNVRHINSAHLAHMVTLPFSNDNKKVFTAPF